MDQERMDKIRRKGAVFMPSLLTVGNLAFGFFAILSASSGQFFRASWLILAGGALDIIDGRIARLLHGESAFGMEFDSLADFATFCLAPGYMMHRFILKDYGMWGAPICFFYVLCGGLRLARFNVSAQSAEHPVPSFRGLPTPVGAAFLASFVLLYEIIELNSPVRTMRIVMQHIPLLYVLIPFIMVGISFLMVSGVPYQTFKQSSFLRPRSVKTLLMIVGIVFVVWAYPRNVIFLVVSGYVISGPVGVMVRSVQRMWNRSD